MHSFQLQHSFKVSALEKEFFLTHNVLEKLEFLFQKYILQSYKKVPLTFVKLKYFLFHISFESFQRQLLGDRIMMKVSISACPWINNQLPQTCTQMLFKNDCCYKFREFSHIPVDLYYPECCLFFPHLPCIYLKLRSN